MGVFMDSILKKKNSNGLGKWSCKRKNLTLSKLAEEGKHTYWKFSQSEKDRSVEAHYIEYEEGKIIIVKDRDKLLSFVSELNIVRCYMYGDLLTKFVFDNTNEKFKEIGDCQVRYLEGLGEYESKKLLTEKTYSLGDVETIKKIVEFCNSKRDFIFLFHNRYVGNFETCLRNNNFEETADLMKYLNEIYNKNKILNFSECKDYLLERINDF